MCEVMAAFDQHWEVAQKGKNSKKVKNWEKEGKQVWAELSLAQPMLSLAVETNQN